MKSYRIVLAAVGMMLLGVGAAANFNQFVPAEKRVGPDWFQTVSLFGGSAFPWVGVVLLIAAVVGTERGRRFVRLNWLMLGVGVLCVLVGGTLLGIEVYRFISPLFFAIAIKLGPQLVSVGFVLIRATTAAPRAVGSAVPRSLSLGTATQRTGLALTILSLALPLVAASRPREEGMLGTILLMELLPAGLALQIVGALISAREGKARPPAKRVPPVSVQPCAVTTEAVSAAESSSPPPPPAE